MRLLTNCQEPLQLSVSRFERSLYPYFSVFVLVSQPASFSPFYFYFFIFCFQFNFCLLFVCTSARSFFTFVPILQLPRSTSTAQLLRCQRQRKSFKSGRKIRNETRLWLQTASGSRATKSQYSKVFEGQNPLYRKVGQATFSTNLTHTYHQPDTTQ